MRCSILLLPLLLAAGCGSSSSDRARRASPAPAATSTAGPGEAAAAAFRNSASAICRRLNSELEATPAHSASLAEIARISPGRAKQERRAADELSRLKEPESTSAARWRSLVAARETLARELAELGEVARRHDVKMVRKLVASKAILHKRQTALAGQLGIQDCATIG